MEAPFYVGQKVVCVETFFWPKEWLGKTGTVISYEVLPCGCGNIKVSGFNTDSHYCSRHNTPSIGGASPKMFAPILPREVAIDEAIIEQAKEMIGVDEVAVPQKEVPCT